ncbi:MAG TPA: hypothetical protein VHH34_25005 [Pseudonocardiaceae bacterium]|nr:hypothetical protein [Pseudonocardiaceae bacterium]
MSVAAVHCVSAGASGPAHRRADVADLIGALRAPSHMAGEYPIIDG